MAPQNYKNVDWASYESLNLNTPHSIVAASTGGGGSGEAAFWLTAPEPIFVCAFDAYGLNRVGNQFKTRPDGTAKDIRIGRFRFDPQPYGDDRKKLSDAATKVWDSFVETYRVALKNARTILW